MLHNGGQWPTNYSKCCIQKFGICGWQRNANIYKVALLHFSLPLFDLDIYTHISKYLIDPLLQFIRNPSFPCLVELPVTPFLFQFNVCCDFSCPLDNWVGIIYCCTHKGGWKMTKSATLLLISSVVPTFIRTLNERFSTHVLLQIYVCPLNTNVWWSRIYITVNVPHCPRLCPLGIWMCLEYVYVIWRFSCH